VFETGVASLDGYEEPNPNNYFWVNFTSVHRVMRDLE
jgi:hypothetical protein